MGKSLEKFEVAEVQELGFSMSIIDFKIFLGEAGIGGLTRI